MAADCPFCAIIAAEADADADAPVVYSDPDVVAFLDHRPVFKGHTLVVPRQHVVTLAELPDSLLVPVFSVVRRVAAAMEAGFGADGTFVANNNRISQSVAHLHVHVVPRHKKDGLRGFFWPRVKYSSPEEAADVAARVREAIATEASRFPGP
ncbi:MAG: histidine triad family protein [Actinomycetota bacterium]|jgi:histidine triad (HIT) family protein|nr:histidine triad family protein [Actinomycetota bacterium]